ncbi:hypothetical protein KAT80_00655 [Candidatus Pacearchaeota archaeon]|nr:hypothetical protein [Candidatus Pacearchaeota archaeon]
MSLGNQFRSEEIAQDLEEASLIDIKDKLFDLIDIFHAELKKFPQIRDSGEIFKKGVELFGIENHSAFLYRSALIRKQILGLGLEKQMPEIIDGMNQTCKRVLVSDLKGTYSIEQYQQISRANSYALFQFGLDYVNKWSMYDNLF